VTFLLDTHALIAFLAADWKRVGREARRILDRAGKGAVDARVSVVSLWEVAVMVEKRRLRLSTGWSAWSSAVQRSPHLTIESLVLADVDHARAFPTLVDPADRLIVGTALRLDATLVTNDVRITKSRVVPTAW
jgi:PIN domain nuclease of toxin-antitoxin system